ncbi:MULTISPECIES: tyrosine-type recombinase/integrase [Burkholderia]|uniref:Prophage CPS-53 integrase,integrase,Site-specific recombinase XerC,Phage integrase family n=2 Tax=Burkholderia cepacia complex TaxID=87882 RepID=A0AAJ5NCZ0_9BURK|nr:MULTISPECIES: integrase arm-type DNA-binding domain-containing protein [Burkholderia]MBO7754512.1 tyrosine-type recombinase/integrase [Burkholderia pseudomallei]OMG73869.1 integrase [Burkholderia ubonensis]VBB13014.1 Putative prophage CPS-53 integrase,integrase,Site-specific recombinase XerC,Phage integrase family [Burkholderia stabilis]
MLSTPLTDLRCRTARYTANGTGNKLFDGGGLFLELRASGAKKWRLKYRFNGKENLLTFGDYPLVSLAEARAKRDEAKRTLAAGLDPAMQRDMSRHAQIVAAQNTFETVAREWHEMQCGTWSVDHARRVMDRLEKDVFPHLGRRPISEISAPELLAVIRRIESRGALETSRKTHQTCGQVFRYAIAVGKAERDPSPDLRGALKTRAVKNMARVSEGELPELLAAIDGYDGDRRTKLALRLLSLTFVRTVELRFAEWSEFDLERAEWRIPAPRMKMRQPHIVPLSRQALAVIQAIRDTTTNKRWLLPSPRNPEQPISENTILYALYRMGFHGRMTGHGFRGLASTVLNERGFSPDWIERQLAHTEQNSIRAAYNHAQHLPERHRMMQWWADYLDQQSGANVKLIDAGTPRAA